MRWMLDLFHSAILALVPVGSRTRATTVFSGLLEMLSRKANC
jgi:hypothetical protein